MLTEVVWKNKKKNPNKEWVKTTAIATNRKLRKWVIANNVQEVLSEKARHDEEILKAAYSKKKKTNEMPSHSNTKTSTATSSEEAAQTTTTTSTKTTTTKTSEAAGTTTVKTKQKQSKLTIFFQVVVSCVDNALSTKICFALFP